MNKYQDIIKRIAIELPSEKVKSSPEDKTLIKSSNKDREQYSQRDMLYTDLLGSYIRGYKSKTTFNKVYKMIFFVTAMLVFVGVVGCAGFALIYASLHIEETNVWSSVAIAISSAAGIISSIIVLPKIIAEHLFPTDEDTNMIGIVKEMQKNDSNIRPYLKEKNEN